VLTGLEAAALYYVQPGLALSVPRL